MTNKEIYETAMLSLYEVEGPDLTVDQSRTIDILREILPAYYEEDSREAEVVLALLTGEGDEELTSFACDPTELRELFKRLENIETDQEWSEVMVEIGWLCLETLSAVWTEELLD